MGTDTHYRVAKTRLIAIANNHKQFKDFEFEHEKDKNEGIRELINIALKYIGMPETKGSSALKGVYCGERSRTEGEQNINKTEKEQLVL